MNKKLREDIIPSIFTAITLFSILFVIRLEDSVVLTSFAATAFIVFTLPENDTAKSRNVVWGHLIGLLSGTFTTLLGKSVNIPSLLNIAIALAISTFIMSIIDLHHPPANGTALAVAINGISLKIISSITTGILFVLFYNIIYKKWFYKITLK